MITDPATKLMTVDAAKRVGLSYQQLVKLRCEGGGPPFFKLGRRIVYAVGDIDAWLKSKRCTELPKANPGTRSGSSRGTAAAHAVV